MKETASENQIILLNSKYQNIYAINSIILFNLIGS